MNEPRDPDALRPLTLDEANAVQAWEAAHPELAPKIGWRRQTWKELVVGGPTIAGVPEPGLLKEITWAYERALFQRQRAERAEFVLAILLAAKEPPPAD